MKNGEQTLGATWCHMEEYQLQIFVESIFKKSLFLLVYYTPCNITLPFSNSTFSCKTRPKSFSEFLNFLQVHHLGFYQQNENMLRIFCLMVPIISNPPPWPWEGGGQRYLELCIQVLGNQKHHWAQNLRPRPYGPWSQQLSLKLAPLYQVHVIQCDSPSIGAQCDMKEGPK